MACESRKEIVTALRVMVAGYRDDQPDFFFCIVRAARDQITAGDHLAEAEDLAEDHGLDPAISFDETMPAGKAILGAFAWGSATTVEVKPS